MRMVHQPADGMIWVRTDSGPHYGATPEDFLADYGSPAPALPAGMNERIYESGKRHALIKDNSVINGGPMPWPQGDQILAAYPQLMAAKQARDEAAQSPSIKNNP